MLGQISLFTILLLGVSTVRSQHGSCETLKPVDNLDINQFMGKWYMQELYVNAYGENTSCLNAVYSYSGNDTVAVTINGVKDNKPISISGTAKIVSSGVFSVSFSSLHVENQIRSVLATDYKALNVMYSCNTNSVANAWILTRDKNPSQAVMNAGHKMLSDKKLPISSLKTIQQNGCSN